MATVVANIGLICFVILSLYFGQITKSFCSGATSFLLTPEGPKIRVDIKNPGHLVCYILLTII
jgi:hypothetical protein